MIRLSLHRKMSPLCSPQPANMVGLQICKPSFTVKVAVTLLTVGCHQIDVFMIFSTFLRHSPMPSSHSMCLHWQIPLHIRMQQRVSHRCEVVFMTLAAWPVLFWILTTKSHWHSRPPIMNTVLKKLCLSCIPVFFFYLDSASKRCSDFGCFMLLLIS